MDDLDRLYRRLVQNVRASRPEYLQIPFTVQELYEQLVPYRHNRRELAIETNQDYEVAVARLLAGERGYARADPAMQEALQRELASPTGDAGAFKEYAQSQITLAPVADTTPHPVPPPVAARAEHGAAFATPAGAAVATAAAPMPPVAPPAPLTPDATEAASQQSVPSLLSSLTNIEVPTGCRFCGGTLPEGRDVHYCPHCGQNLKTKRCPACGAEMDTSWKFCVTCGRQGG